MVPGGPSGRKGGGDRVTTGLRRLGLMLLGEIKNTTEAGCKKRYENGQRWKKENKARNKTSTEGKTDEKQLTMVGEDLGEEAIRLETKRPSMAMLVRDTGKGEGKTSLREGQSQAK